VERTELLTEILEFLWLCDIGICYIAADSQATKTETHLLVFSCAVITLQTSRANAGRIKEQELHERT
jgi:hypothetical protein